MQTVFLPLFLGCPSVWTCTGNHIWQSMYHVLGTVKVPEKGSFQWFFHIFLKWYNLLFTFVSITCIETRFFLCLQSFDVKSVPSPINIAYSNVALGLHMDLMYYESPPGLQLLHCVR